MFMFLWDLCARSAAMLCGLGRSGDEERRVLSVSR